MAWYASNAWIGRDVLTERPSRIRPLDEREAIRRAIFDTESGIVTSRRLWPTASRGAQLLFQIQSRAEIADARALIDHLCGRWRGIWVPSWQHDLVLAADIAMNASTWAIKAVGFGDRYLPDESRRHLVLTLPNNTFIYRRVLAVTDNMDGTETLDVRFDQYGTGNPTPISRDVPTVSFLRWMRLERDDVEIERMAEHYLTVTLPLIERPADVPTL